jgi:opacity protein-like surface antigen
MKRACLLAAVLLGLAGRAAAGDGDNKVSLGVKGSESQDTSERTLEWGPTITGEIYTSTKTARTRFKYEMEFSYDNSLSRLSSDGERQSTRVSASELRVGKVSLLQVARYDLKERLRFVPYVAGGLQYVDSRSTSGSDVEHDAYWAATWGAGIEFSLGKRTALALDYDANTLGGDRRVAHLSLELKVAVLGDPDD